MLAVEPGAGAIRPVSEYLREERSLPALSLSQDALSSWPLSQEHMYA